MRPRKAEDGALHLPVVAREDVAAEHRLKVGASFNRDLNWDTSQVTSMDSTFQGADAFNSELDWDTSSVTRMTATFNGATAFNQPLAWDTGSINRYLGGFSHFGQCAALIPSNPYC